MSEYPNKEREKRLLDIASSQSGYFTAKQAQSAGYSYRLQHYHRHRRNWGEVERGVFRLRNFSGGQHEDLVRWSLWSRDRQDKPQAIISHETACVVHEIGPLMPSKVHLSVSPGFRRKPPGGCILHRRILAEDSYVRHPDGFYVTRPLQSVLDMAETHIELEYLEEIIYDGLHRGLFIPRDVIEARVPPQIKTRIEEAMVAVNKKMLRRL